MLSDNILKVKGPDIYIPPLTGKPWPAADIALNNFKEQWCTVTVFICSLMNTEPINEMKPAPNFSPVLIN